MRSLKRATINIPDVANKLKIRRTHEYKSSLSSRPPSLIVVSTKSPLQQSPLCYFGRSIDEEDRTKQKRDIRKKNKGSNKALEILEYTPNSSKSEIRKKFKEVVKKLHPDTNGGDSSQEDLLKEVISAYKYLKSQGHC